ncbi:unnamed protein product, partial [Rotaria magnacalcarata]
DDLIVNSHLLPLNIHDHHDDQDSRSADSSINYNIELYNTESMNDNIYTELKPRGEHRTFVLLYFNYFEILRGTFVL